MKLRTRLLVFSLLVSIAPFLIIGATSLLQGRAALSRQAFSQLESLNEVKKQEIEKFFAGRREDMRLLLEMVNLLYRNAIQKLQSVQENKLAQVRAYFKQRYDDIKVLSAQEIVAQAVEQYDGAVKMEGEAGGMAWESIDARLGEALRQFRAQYAYHDLLLIAEDGDIVFTATRGPDLGQNVLDGKLKDSSLHQAFKQGREGVALVDYAPYPPAEGRHVAFLAAPVFRFGEFAGTVILALTADPLNAIMQRREGMGETGESYLVGARNGQTEYRSDRVLNAETGIFGQPKTGPNIQKALKGESGVSIQANENNILMVGAYAPVKVPGLQWAMLSTMTLEEAITPRLPNSETDFFTKYISEYHYYDLLLIHPNGNVFYTVRRGSDYNTNIREGRYADTHFARLIETVLARPRPSMSDYALYPPSGNRPAAFLAQPLMSGEDVELIVALQMDDTALNALMEERTGLGETGETYLVGDDALMRSNSVLSPATHSLRASLTLPEMGRVETPSSEAALNGDSGHWITHNYRGERVLSAYAPLTVGDKRWALIAEMSVAEAFAPIRELEILVGVLAFILVVLIWLFVNRFTRHLITPLLRVNHHLKSMAQGRLAEDNLEYRGRDEIAEIVNSAHQLKSAFRSTMDQAHAIAAGDYSQEVRLLSDHDQLGIALRDMTRTLRQVIAQANAIAAGDYSREVRLLSERDQLGEALLKMTRTLREVTARNEEARRQLEYENAQKSQQDWVKSGQTGLNEQMGGEQELNDLGKHILSFLAGYVGAQVGTFYVYKETVNHQEPDRLKLIATYAYKRRKTLNGEIELGEGLVGQAALERETILVSQLPEDYIPVQSSLGNAPPRYLLLLPFLYETNLKGVMELGRFEPFEEIHLDFLEQVLPAIGIAVNTTESRARLRELLQQSRTQTEELQTQAEELQSQQEELRQTNEELEERTRDLERQKEAIRQKNQELEKTRAAIEQKAEELELASKYKSEFLANMSHELRTPLNSMLILAQMLKTNRDGNLTEKQLEFAQTIHTAGSDLLKLINEILDLAKVEAGRLEVHCETHSLESLREVLARKFQHLAQEKGLEFRVEMAPELPTKIYTDSQRLQQIVTNLLSNAFKFTESGGEVVLRIGRPAPGTRFSRSDLNPETTLAFRVSDTGLGIPEDKQKLIFEAFQQADGSTSRRYGGTGLGLSISREMANLLGGELQLESEENQGSTFTLLVPESYSPESAASGRPMNAKAAAAAASATLTRHKQDSGSAGKGAKSDPPSSGSNGPEDDREQITEHDKVLMIVEDDQDFARVLQDTAHEKNFKCVIAEDGKQALDMAEKYQPHAIILDVGLPQVDGWTVMERLKDNPRTRHIPVHFISGNDQKQEAQSMGAIGYLVKPVSMESLGQAFHRIENFIENKLRRVLLVMDQASRIEQVKDLIGSERVSLHLEEDIDPAWEALCREAFDCIILDAGVAGDKGLELLERLKHEEKLTPIPIILYAERDLSEGEEKRLQECADSLTVKAVRSPERLLDESILFLHQVETQLPARQQGILQKLHDKESLFAGRKILLADDDVRNIFALTTILEEKGVEVLVARNGQEAVDKLLDHPDTALVLMDIMMPVLDGYAAMREIRARPPFRKLPIIALTAKAMKGDRVKCLEAGANDYLSKPLDMDKLLSLIRVWLYR